MSIVFTLHLLAAAIWVGGMFFAYIALRPVAASLLEPPVRLALWQGVFKNFFPWVWVIVLALPLSGYLIIFNVYQGMANVGISIHIMQLLGWIMVGVYIYLYFSPYKALIKNLSNKAIPEAAKNLNRIRQLIATNLSLGLITIIVAGFHRF